MVLFGHQCEREDENSLRFVFVARVQLYGHEMDEWIGRFVFSIMGELSDSCNVTSLHTRDQ